MAIIYPIFPPIVSGIVYNVSAQTVPVETDVIFDTNGNLSPGITHTPGTTQIAVSNPGKYEVTFSVTGVEPNQFALFLNGALVIGTVYGSGAGTQQNNGQAIIALAVPAMFLLCEIIVQLLRLAFRLWLVAHKQT